MSKAVPIALLSIAAFCVYLAVTPADPWLLLEEEDDEGEDFPAIPPMQSAKQWLLLCLKHSHVWQALLAQMCLWSSDVLIGAQTNWRLAQTV
jgi:hypothetical protein